MTSEVTMSALTKPSHDWHLGLVPVASKSTRQVSIEWCSPHEMQDAVVALPCISMSLSFGAPPLACRPSTF